jgi:hypothetical protein
MSKDAVARAAIRIEAWIRLYTRRLPPAVARDRRDEVLADIHDQAEWALSQGTPAPHVARALLGRALRGAPADVTWAASLASPGRALDRALVGLVATLILLLIALDAVALTRQAPFALTGGALAVVVGISLGAGALALLARRRTRWLAALWVVATAHVTLFDGVAYLAESTTILRHVAGESSAWRTGLVVADIGVIVLCAAAAVWWARPASNRRGFAEIDARLPDPSSGGS